MLPNLHKASLCCELLVSLLAVASETTDIADLILKTA
jgi:hypothetical protein